VEYGLDFARYLYAWMSGLDIESVMSGIDPEGTINRPAVQRQIFECSSHSGRSATACSSARADGGVWCQLGPQCAGYLPDTG